MIGDRIQLQQVVVNLLMNSVQAMAQGGGPARRIDLRTNGDDDSGVVFTIRDTGPGIANENLDRIFESFFTTKHTGMGMGLAICRSIIVGHGGGITASNRPDGGAQFQFSLPGEPSADALIAQTYLKVQVHLLLASAEPSKLHDIGRLATRAIVVSPLAEQQQETNMTNTSLQNITPRCTGARRSGSVALRAARRRD